MEQNDNKNLSLFGKPLSPTGLYSLGGPHFRSIKSRPYTYGNPIVSMSVNPTSEKPPKIAETRSIGTQYDSRDCFTEKEDDWFVVDEKDMKTDI